MVWGTTKAYMRDYFIQQKLHSKRRGKIAQAILDEIKRRIKEICREISLIKLNFYSNRH